MTLIQAKQANVQISVPNQAGLTAFSVTNVSDGTLAYEGVSRSYWQILTLALALAPNEIIASNVPGRVWVRMPDMTSPSWAGQAAWQIDSVLGNDQLNSGAPGSPLRTCAELTRRIGSSTRIDIAVDVEIVSMLPTDGLSIASIFSRLGNYYFHGRPTVIMTGTVQALPLPVPPNPAANIPGSFQGSLGTGAQVGQRITLEPGSSTPGAYAWIVSATGDNVRLSSWLMPEPFPNSGFPTPAPFPVVGDAYRIESLPVVPAIDVEFRADDFTLNPQQIFVTFQDLSITPPPIVSASVGASALGSMIFLGCDVNVDAIGGGCDYLLSGCRSRMSQVIQGRWFFNGGCCIGQDMSATNGGYMSFDFDFILQGGTMRARNTAFLRIAACAVFDSPGDGVLIEMSAVRCKNGTFISGPSLLWGSGNAGVGVNCNGFLSYEVLPVITGVGDTKVGGPTVRPWGAMPFVEPTNLSAIVINV